MSSNLPNAGPIILTVPGITDVLIAAGAPSTVGPVVQFQWPRPYVLSAIWLNVRSGSLVELAALRLRIQNSSRNELITDGNGTRNNQGGLQLMGRAPRWQPLRWDIRAGDRWIFQLTNDSGVDVVPWFGMKVEI